MRVLFVSSGNSGSGASTIVRNQGESLQAAGVEVDYFGIQGRGIKGYLKNVIPLRRHAREQHFDVIHAHYSLSGFAATLAGCKPLVVSLMGSDIRLGFFLKNAVKLCNRLIWDTLIVKSQNMVEKIGIDKCQIIPNGVNTSLFFPSDRKKACNSLGWDERRKHILFAADPTRPVKNFGLFERAFDLLDSAQHIDIHTLGNTPHPTIPNYINASDVVVLTSLWEGSPNVIKESMACNRPIVCTDVGDVRWLFGDESGHYVTSFEDKDVAVALRMALDFAYNPCRTKGRIRLIELGLDSAAIGSRLCNVYDSVLMSDG